MTMHVFDWKFKGACDETRILTLQTAVPFEDIAGWIRREMDILCGHTVDCGDKQGYRRVIYCVEVTPYLFDIFFNSQYGYRGAYYQSPECGLSANALLFNTVAPRLIEWTRNHYAVQDTEFATKSLLGESAKAWLAEETLSRCEQCTGEWNSSVRSDIEILNCRWESDSHQHAEWGRQAPLFRKIRFIGAFLNDAGEEYVASHKKDRAADICARGWS